MNIRLLAVSEVVVAAVTATTIMIVILSFVSDAFAASVSEQRQQKEWIADWWNWVMLHNETETNTVSDNILEDPTGANIMKYQPTNQEDDDVYFLAGAPNTTMVRNVTLPAGKTIFMPLLCGMNFCTSCNSMDFFFREMERKLVDAARINDTTYLEARLDGELIPYDRIRSDLFELSLIDDQMRTYPAVADGYWITIKPDRLPVGEHVLYAIGKEKHRDGSYYTEVTYNLRVQ